MLWKGLWVKTQFLRKSKKQLNKFDRVGFYAIDRLPERPTMILIALVFFFFHSTQSLAAMEYIYNGPESAADKRYSFHWELLRQALELTRPTHGPYHLRPAVFMSEQRQQVELRKASGKITVMILGTTEDMERALTPIRIPVDKGLSGYFVCLIHKDLQKALAQVRTLKDLKKFKVGLASDWLDSKVYTANGFQVIPGNNYEGLFHMTGHKRFDIFPRSVVEVMPEWEGRRASIPDLAIEKKLLLYYHWPM